MLPLARSGKSSTAWLWQPSGPQWKRTIDQSSPLAPIVPSSASVADPLNEIVSPTCHVNVAAGDAIVGTGGVLPPVAPQASLASAQSAWSESTPSPPAATTSRSWLRPETLTLMAWPASVPRLMALVNRLAASPKTWNVTLPLAPTSSSTPMTAVKVVQPEGMVIRTSDTAWVPRPL